jgi:hypothetical protein
MHVFAIDKAAPPHVLPPNAAGSAAVIHCHPTAHRWCFQMLEKTRNLMYIATWDS